MVLGTLSGIACFKAANCTGTAIGTANPAQYADAWFNGYSTSTDAAAFCAGYGQNGVTDVYQSGRYVTIGKSITGTTATPGTCANATADQLATSKAQAAQAAFVNTLRPAIAGRSDCSLVAPTNDGKFGVSIKCTGLSAHLNKLAASRTDCVNTSTSGGDSIELTCAGTGPINSQLDADDQFVPYTAVDVAADASTGGEEADVEVDAAVDGLAWADDTHGRAHANAHALLL
eukprot:tig00020710_g13395.t1